MNAFSALAIAFAVSLPTGAYLITHDNGVAGFFCIILPFFMGASRERKEIESDEKKISTETNEKNKHT